MIPSHCWSKHFFWTILHHSIVFLPLPIFSIPSTLSHLKCHITSLTISLYHYKDCMWPLMTVNSSVILSFRLFSFFLPLCITCFRAGKRIDVPYLVYMFNGSCSYPNSLPIRSYFMDEHAHNEYGPYLNKYVTSQLDSRAQRAAVAQCHLGTLLQSVGVPQSAKNICYTRKELQSLEDLGKALYSSMSPFFLSNTALFI